MPGRLRPDHRGGAARARLAARSRRGGRAGGKLGGRAHERVGGRHRLTKPTRMGGRRRANTSLTRCPHPHHGSVCSVCRVSHAGGTMTSAPSRDLASEDLWRYSQERAHRRRAAARHRRTVKRISVPLAVAATAVGANATTLAAPAFASGGKTRTRVHERRILRLGASGAEVTHLQRLLGVHGDGHFGDGDAAGRPPVPGRARPARRRPGRTAHLGSARGRVARRARRGGAARGLDRPGRCGGAAAARGHRRRRLRPDHPRGRARLPGPPRPGRRRSGGRSHAGGPAPPARCGAAPHAGTAVGEPRLTRRRDRRALPGSALRVGRREPERL